MFKFIAVLLLSIVITKFLNIFFGEKNAEHEADKSDKTYIVSAPSGIIGCLTRDKYYEAANDYAKKNVAAVEKLMAEKICFFFKKGEALSAPAGTCVESDGDNDLFAFSSERFMLLKPYLPCFAVR